MTRHMHLVYLTDWFIHENSGASGILGINPSEITRETLAASDEDELFSLFRALVNVRPVYDIPENILLIQDEFLKGEINLKGITDIRDINSCAHYKIPDHTPEYIIWQGDITTIKVDAIVNAANSALLGCWAPNHGCIDNAIHTYAGIQLRAECQRLMEYQGHDEFTGTAKLTGAYNLPSRYILHTVGPIVHGTLTTEDEKLLASCYESCLTLATEYHCKSIAFCCISTGEFHFPNQRAAEIAFKTVRDYIARQKESSISHIIFNVFKDIDKEIYTDIINNNHCNT